MAFRAQPDVGPRSTADQIRSICTWRDIRCRRKLYPTDHRILVWLFVAMAIVSASLLVFVSADAWLFFANVLNLPLVVTAFVAEYVYRSVRFPNGPYPSLAATVAAFRRFRETIRE
jgi:hypothetical protein